jgi:hypothetical protein
VPKTALEWLNLYRIEKKTWVVLSIFSDKYFQETFLIKYAHVAKTADHFPFSTDLIPLFKAIKYGTNDRDLILDGFPFDVTLPHPFLYHPGHITPINITWNLCTVTGRVVKGGYKESWPPKESSAHTTCNDYTLTIVANSNIYVIKVHTKGSIFTIQTYEKDLRGEISRNQKISDGSIALKFDEDWLYLSSSKNWVYRHVICVDFLRWNESGLLNVLNHIRFPYSKSMILSASVQYHDEDRMELWTITGMIHTNPNKLFPLPISFTKDYYYPNWLDFGVVKD